MKKAISTSRNKTPVRLAQTIYRLLSLTERKEETVFERLQFLVLPAAGEARMREKMVASFTYE